jgi:tRNA pseudouridine38-40 synthase
MALRAGFTRYALRIQYHGLSFLGFSKQNHEDCIMSDGTDVRGYTSVETRLARALEQMTRRNGGSFEHVQVSSRTDRGVHALGNTFHVDVSSELNLKPDQLHRMVNSFLRHDVSYGRKKHSKRIRNDTLMEKGGDYARSSPGNDIRIVAAAFAPDKMLSDYEGQREYVDWNARFSATQRTYMYRIVHGRSSDWGDPFEWDRAWMLDGESNPLDVDAMRMAANYLIGQNDFSSFRNRGCARSTAVVNLQRVEIRVQPYNRLGGWEVSSEGGLFGIGCNLRTADESVNGQQLITILFQSNAFLYRQVRNMVAILVAVGRKKLLPDEIPAILEAKDRTTIPTGAPAAGLFLVHVQHGDFYF